MEQSLRNSLFAPRQKAATSGNVMSLLQAYMRIITETLSFIKCIHLL